MEFDATFIIAIVSFVLFVFVMNKIYYAPVIEIISKREEYVASNYAEAKDAKQKISSNTEIKNSKLEETRGEGRKIINEKTSELKSERDQKIHSARVDSVNKVAHSKEDLFQKAYSAQDVLISNAVDISKEISKIILGEELSTESINGESLKKYRQE